MSGGPAPAGALGARVAGQGAALRHTAAERDAFLDGLHDAESTPAALSA